jgi:TldD protein
MTVLLGPGWPGVLLHEAVGHGLEGDFNRKGTSAFSGRIGERVAAPGVTVVDDGAMAGRRGSLSIDDEGTPTQENVLIEDGILKGYMQDRLNARLMGVAPTGNGRRESYAHAPMPRMTNTFMRAGKDDPAELLSRVKNGIFAKSFRRRAGGYRLRQVRVLLHRGLQDRKRQAGRADQGRDADRRWPDRAHPRGRHRQRYGAG